LTLFSIESQTRREKPAGDRASADNRILERQLLYAATAEERGELNSAYLAYAQLIKRHETDLRVVSGYVDISIKSGKVKECEVKVKDLAVKYPVKQGLIDPDDKTASFGLRLLGFLSEVYFRTGRDPAGYEVHSMIESANTSKQFKSEIKAISFMRSGRLLQAEKIFREIRKELKKSDLYSTELFMINYSLGKIEKFTSELLRSAVSETKKKPSEDLTSFNPRAELFRLYEAEELKDSILRTVERSFLEGSEKTGLILSELYFSSGNYDKAFEILRKSSKDEGADNLTADFAIKLYNEKQYDKASYFFSLVYNNKISVKDEELIIMYISSLENSSRPAEAVRIIKESGIGNGELMTAKIYHNYLGMLEEADRLYGDNLTSNKSLYPYWRDYIMLKIIRKKYKDAVRVIDKVFKENIMDIFSPEPFFELKYYEAVTRLFLNKEEEFARLSDVLIRDNFISDLDNDLLKIKRDLAVIGDDKEFFNKYTEVFAHRMNNPVRIREIEFDYLNEQDGDKKLLMMETAFFYHSLREEKENIIELSKAILGSGLMNNNFARLIARYSKTSTAENGLREILMSILKTGVNEEIKAEIRDIIREREPS
jgi:hypothetical protein